MNQGRKRVKKKKTYLRGQKRQGNLHLHLPPPSPVISLQIPTTPRSSERTGACPSVAPSCLSPLPATGGSASATPSTSGSSALPSLFDRTPDRNIGASGNLSHKKRTLKTEKSLLFNNLYIVKNHDLLF